MTNQQRVGVEEALRAFKWTIMTGEQTGGGSARFIASLRQDVERLEALLFPTPPTEETEETP